MIQITDSLIDLLESKHQQYNSLGFIQDDPISIPHRYTKQEDIEIMGFFAATLAWGQRKTIIKNCLQLEERMDRAPFDFVFHHTDADLKKMLGFVHRTFNDTDLLYFIHFLKDCYLTHGSLENTFCAHTTSDENVKNALIQFHTYFCSSPDFPPRTKKHVPNPSNGSACKRINMYLRWMVRTDPSGVDFGIWKKIKPAQLICPLDIHVERVGRKLNLIQRTKADWQTAEELTNTLKLIDPNDPVRFDFALFGLGIEGFAT